MTTPDNRIEQAAEAAMRGMAEAWVTDDAELFAEVAIGAAKGMHAAGLLLAEPDTASEEVAKLTSELERLREHVAQCHELQNNVAAVLDVETDWDDAGRAAVLDAARRVTGRLADAEARIDKALAICDEGAGLNISRMIREALASPGDPAESDRAIDELEVKREAVREARGVISQYLATAEKWRYDRVMWAFAIMLGEIPEDTPCPLSPADEEELRRRGVEPAPQAQRDALVWAEDDPEPPVGTVGRNRNGRVTTWTRKDYGWHCGPPGCPACPTDWAEVTGWGGPLVEVIEPAPPQDDTTEGEQ